MGADRFLRACAFVQKRRALFLAMTTVVAGCALFALSRISFDSTLDLMLPEGGEIQRAFRFLREANFSDKVVISLDREDQDLDLQDFIATVDELAVSLSPPLVSRVVTGAQGSHLMEDFTSLLQYVPQILGEEDLADVDAQLTREGVRTQLRTRYMQLLKPEGSFMAPMIRNDPLGLQSVVAEKVGEVFLSFGYEVNIEDGHFLSHDGNHALLILETPVRLTDSAGSRELLDYLNEQTGRLADKVSANIVCGHLHTVGNEEVMKKDIGLTITIASVAFLLLFFICFRDVRAVFIFLIPVLSIVLSIGLSALLFGRLCTFVVGLGAVIAGVAVDYGIHVYVAVSRTEGGPEATAAVARPVALGALTTIGVFVAFLFSRIEGYRQLSVVSVISIILSLACALFILPLLLGRGAKSKHSGDAAVATRAVRRPAVVLVVFALLVLGGLYFALDVSFDSRMTQLDGASKAVFDAESRFHDVWGGGEQAQGLLAVSAPDYESALELNQEVYEHVLSRLGDDDFVSFAAIWPSRSRRQANAERWCHFWQDGREARLRELLSEEGGRYSFADNAFDPFFEGLYEGQGISGEPQTNLVFSKIAERFVRQNESGCRVLSFFPDEARYVELLRELRQADPNIFLVSREALAKGFSASVSSELRMVSAIAVVLVLLVTFVFLRDVRMSCVALVPTVAGVLGFLGWMGLRGASLNVAHLIAGIVVIGLCIDYGIYMTYAHRHQLRSGTGTSVTLSAVTTLIGAGVLLFAKHPALYSIGVTLVAGVFCGYLSAMLVVPAMWSLFKAPARKDGQT